MQSDRKLPTSFDSFSVVKLKNAKQVFPFKKNDAEQKWCLFDDIWKNFLSVPHRKLAFYKTLNGVGTTYHHLNAATKAFKDK